MSVLGFILCNARVIVMVICVMLRISCILVVVSLFIIIIFVLIFTVIMSVWLKAYECLSYALCKSNAQGRASV
jgi:hypothetical protein